MRQYKVEISGTDTSKLISLTEDEKRELLRRTKAGDSEARERMITGNIRLVLSIIQRFTPKHESIDDLFQVGCIGLIKAIDNFDPSFDVRFSTYAVPMIIGEVRRFQRDDNSLRVSRGLRDLAYRALQIKEDVMRRELREPAVAEIAARLEVSEREVEEAMAAIVEPVSLYDSVYGDGDDKTYVIDQLADNDRTDDALIESIALAEALKKLNERELSIIRRRYYAGKTQMEIADEIGISQAQVSRLEKGAIDKLRKYMQ